MFPVEIAWAARILALWAFVGGYILDLNAPAAAEECTQASDPIETDRPDVTNSAIVVPDGSMQSENGANISGRGGTGIFDGSNSRWRLGVAPCLEVLIDVPNYLDTYRGVGSSGFGDVAPAVKWQLSPAPGKLDLSLVVGAALPTGATAIAGSGMQPYLQLPWSLEIGGGWAVTGMQTGTFAPASAARFTDQSTFAIERTINKRSFVFVEYVGTFAAYGGSTHLFNSGGGYRITEREQIDFHIGFGLNRSAPTYIFGIGYSFRLDGLLRPM